MSNPNMENKVKELLELKRMKEELEAEIATIIYGSRATRSRICGSWSKELSPFTKMMQETLCGC